MLAIACRHLKILYVTLQQTAASLGLGTFVDVVHKTYHQH